MDEYNDDFEGLFQSISIKFGGLDVNSASKSELANLLKDPTTATCIRFREVFDIPESVSNELAYQTLLKVLDVVVLSHSEKVFIEDLKQFRKDMHLLKDIHYYVKHLPTVTKKKKLPMWLSPQVKELVSDIPVEGDGLPNNITIINCLKDHSALRESVRARQAIELLGIMKYASRYDSAGVAGEGEEGEEGEEHTHVEHLTEEEILDRELERTTEAYWKKKAENIFHRADIAIQDKCLSRSEINDYLSSNPPPDQMWILEWLMHSNGGSNFDRFDRTKKGEISLRELKEVCREWAKSELGSDFANAHDQAARMLKEELDERAELIMKKADKMKRNEKLTKNEIASFGNLIADAEERLFVTWFLADDNFDIYDTDKSGEIDIKEFRLAIRAWANDQRNNRNQFVEKNQAMQARKKELMEERRDMLKNADSRASEIMELCGFGNNGHLITVLQMRNKILPVPKLRPFGEWMLKDRLRVWRRHDKDKSGTIDLGELENALEEYFDEVASEFDEFRGEGGYYMPYRGSRRTKRVLAELDKRPSPPMFKGSEGDTVTFEWRKEWKNMRLVLQSMIIKAETCKEAHLSEPVSNSEGLEKEGSGKPNHSPLWTTIYRGRNPRAEVTLSQPTSLYLFRTVTVDEQGIESQMELSASNPVFWMNKPSPPSICGIGRNVLVSWSAPVLPPSLASSLRPSRPFWKLHIKQCPPLASSSVSTRPSTKQSSISSSFNRIHTQSTVNSKSSSSLNSKKEQKEDMSLSQMLSGRHLSSTTPFSHGSTTMTTPLQRVMTESGDGAFSRIGSDEIVVNIGQGHTWSLLPHLLADMDYEISLSVEFPMASSNKSDLVRYSTKVAAPVVSDSSETTATGSVIVTNDDEEDQDEGSLFPSNQIDKEIAKQQHIVDGEDEVIDDVSSSHVSQEVSGFHGANSEEERNGDETATKSKEKRDVSTIRSYRSGSTSVTVYLPSMFDPDRVLEKAGIECQYRTEGLGSSGGWETFHVGTEKKLVIHGFAPDIVSKLRVRLSVDLRRCCRYGKGPIHIHKEGPFSALHNPLVELGLAPFSAFGSTLYNEDLKGGGGVNGHAEVERRESNDFDLIEGSELPKRAVTSSGDSVSSFQSTTTVGTCDGAWFCPLNLIPFPGASKARSEKFAELVGNHNMDYEENLRRLSYFWDVSGTTMVCTGPSAPTFVGNEADFSSSAAASSSSSSSLSSGRRGCDALESLVLTCNQPKCLQPSSEVQSSTSSLNQLYAFEVFDKSSGEWFRAYKGTQLKCDLAEVTRVELAYIEKEERQTQEGGTLGYQSNSDDDSLTFASGAIKSSLASPSISKNTSTRNNSRKKNNSKSSKKVPVRSYLPSDCWTLPGVCLLVRSALHVSPKQQHQPQSLASRSYIGKGDEFTRSMAGGSSESFTQSSLLSRTQNSSTTRRRKNKKSSVHTSSSSLASDFKSLNFAISDEEEEEESSLFDRNSKNESRLNTSLQSSYNFNDTQTIESMMTNVGAGVHSTPSWVYSEEMVAIMSPPPPWCEWCNENKNAVLVKWSDALDTSKLPEGCPVPPLLFALEVASGPLYYDGGNGVNECKEPLLAYEEVAVSPGAYSINSGPLAPGCRYAFRLRCVTPNGVCYSQPYYVHTEPTVPSTPELPMAKPAIFKSATGKRTAFVQIAWTCPEHNGLEVDRFLLQSRNTIDEEEEEKQDSRDEISQVTDGQVDEVYGNDGKNINREVDISNNSDLERDKIDSHRITESVLNASLENNNNSEFPPLGQNRRSINLQRGDEESNEGRRGKGSEWASIYIGPHLSASDDSTLHLNHMNKQYRVRAGSKLGWSNWSPVLTVSGELSADKGSKLISPKAKSLKNIENDGGDNLLNKEDPLRSSSSSHSFSLDSSTPQRNQEFANQSQVKSKSNDTLPMPALSIKTNSLSKSVDSRAIAQEEVNEKSSDMEQDVEDESLLVEKGEKFEVFLMVPCCGAGQRMKLTLYAGQAAKLRASNIDMEASDQSSLESGERQAVVYACSSVVGSDNGVDPNELWLSKLDLMKIGAKELIMDLSSSLTLSASMLSRRTKAAQKIFDNIQMNEFGDLFCLEPPIPAKPISVTLLSRSPPTFLLTMPQQGRVFVRGSTISQSCQLKVLFPRLRTSALVEVDPQLLFSLGVPYDSPQQGAEEKDISNIDNEDMPISDTEPKESPPITAHDADASAEKEVEAITGWSCANQGLKLAVISELCSMLLIDQQKGSATIVLPPHFQLLDMPTESESKNSQMAESSTSNATAAVYWNPLRSSQFNLMESWEEVGSINKEDASSFMARDGWGNGMKQATYVNTYDNERDEEDNEAGDDSDDDEEEKIVKLSESERLELEERIVSKVTASMKFGVNEKILRKIVKSSLDNLTGNNRSSTSTTSKPNTPKSQGAAAAFGEGQSQGEDTTKLPDIRGLGMASLAELVQAAAAAELSSKQKATFDSDDGDSSEGEFDRSVSNDDKNDDKKTIMRSPNHRNPNTSNGLKSPIKNNQKILMKSSNRSKKMGNEKDPISSPCSLNDSFSVRSESMTGSYDTRGKSSKKRRARLFTPQLPTDNLTSYSLPFPEVLVKKEGTSSPSKLPPIPMATFQWGR